MRRKLILKNICFTMVLQLIGILNGLIVPKVFISLFGSEANGLITSINQFLNYVNILEGGLGGVVMSALYKPLRENDEKKISAIFNASQHFFKQIGYIYIGYTAVLACVYYFFIDTTFSYAYVAILVVILAVNLFVQYFFSMSYQLLIKASQKVYVLSITRALIMLFNIVLVIVLSYVYADLIFIKALSALVLFIQPLVIYLYSRKHFKLDKTVPKDINALDQRWSGFGHTLAFFINTNVSVMALTLFSSLSMVSVFAVHMSVINAIKNLSNAIASALVPSLGNVIASGDLEESNKAFSIYEFGIGFITSLLFTCGIALVTPFVSVYTTGVVDVNYTQPLFAILLMCAEMVYCFREPYINAAYAVGKFKETAKYAYLEVVLNVVLTIAFVILLDDLIGTALAMLISMSIRLICHVIFLKNNILMRPLRKSAKTALFMFVPAALVSVICMNLLPLSSIDNYFSWIFFGVIVFAISTVVLFISSLIGFKHELRQMFGKRKY